MNVVEAKDPSLVSQAYGVLRSAILRGDLAPGARLRIEALQKAYGLSSSPLREALNRLLVERLVRVEEGRGFAVTPVSRGELEELTSMRLLLEPQALRRSVAAGDDEWEATAVAAFHRLKRAEERIGDEPASLNDDWSLRHRDYHFALLASCPSRRLIATCGALFDEAERYRRLSARLRRKPRKKSGEHADILEAALAHDADRAALLLAAHVEQTAANIADALDELAG